MRWHVRFDDIDRAVATAVPEPATAGLAGVCERRSDHRGVQRAKRGTRAMESLRGRCECCGRSRDQRTAWGDALGVRRPEADLVGRGTVTRTTESPSSGNSSGFKLRLTASPSGPISHSPMSYRTNDNPLACRRPFDRVEHPVVSHASGPSPSEPSHEWLSNDVGLDSKVGKRLQYGVTERMGQAV
jgi:hypothetical protein